MWRHSHTSLRTKQRTKSVGLPAMIMRESTSNDTTPPTSYTVTVEEDGDDIILPIPEEILKTMGWNEGDTLEWSVNNDTITLRKAHDWCWEVEQRTRSVHWERTQTWHSAQAVCSQPGMLPWTDVGTRECARVSQDTTLGRMKHEPMPDWIIPAGVGFMIFTIMIFVIFTLTMIYFPNWWTTLITLRWSMSFTWFYVVLLD